MVMVKILAYSSLVRGKILPIFLEHMGIFFFFLFSFFRLDRKYCVFE